MNDRKKVLTEKHEQLKDRLARRQGAPAGMTYQAKKHRKIIRLVAEVEQLAAEIALF